jgi:hypothetical protein
MHGRGTESGGSRRLARRILHTSFRLYVYAKHHSEWFVGFGLSASAKVGSVLESFGQSLC